MAAEARPHVSLSPSQTQPSQPSPGASFPWTHSVPPPGPSESQAALPGSRFHPAQAWNHRDTGQVPAPCEDLTGILDHSGPHHKMGT